MSEIDIELAQCEEKLRNKVDNLMRKWEELAKHTKTGEEYEATRPVFDEALKAHKEWQEFLFKNGRKLLAKPINDN